MRVHLRTFKPRFADLLNVTKFNTIRPPCKRARDEPQPGDIIDCRVWTGRPYHSAMRQVCYGRVTENLYCIIRRDVIETARGTFAGDELNAFAKADGFFDWRDMRDWFEANHGLPFNGRLIKWEACATPPPV